MFLPTTIAGVIEGCEAAHSAGGCRLCGERHNPRRLSCGDVQSRIDGVDVGRPEGTGGVPCWAGAPARPLVDGPGVDEEWGW